jgi:hypothetical protein
MSILFGTSKIAASGQFLNYGSGQRNLEISIKKQKAGFRDTKFWANFVKAYMFTFEN